MLSLVAFREVLHVRLGTQGLDSIKLTFLFMNCCRYRSFGPESVESLEVYNRIHHNCIGHHWQIERVSTITFVSTPWVARVVSTENHLRVPLYVVEIVSRQKSTIEKQLTCRRCFQTLVKRALLMALLLRTIKHWYQYTEVFVDRIFMVIIRFTVKTRLGF